MALIRGGGELNVMEQWVSFALYIRIYRIPVQKTSSDLPVLTDVSFQKYAKVVFSNGLQKLLSIAS